MEETIKKLIPGAQDVSIFDTFSNFESGGSFIVFKITTQSQDELQYACLFNNERRLKNPFNAKIIEEIELGNNWKVKGCIKPETQQLIARSHYSGQPLSISKDGDSFYLYALDRIR